MLTKEPFEGTDVRPTFVLASLLLLLLAGDDARAAVTLRFVDGDRLTGEVTGLLEGRIVLATAHSGELALRWDRVTGLASEKPMELALTTGEALRGPVRDLDGGWIGVETPEGIRTVALPMIAAIAGTELPAAPLPSPAPPPGLVVVTFRNGDRVSGEDLRLAEGRAVLPTENAGEVTLTWSQVASLESRLPLSLYLASGERLEGTLTSFEGGWMALRTAEGIRTLALPMIAGINADPERVAARRDRPARPAPETRAALPEARDWGGRVDWNALVAWGPSDLGASATLQMWRQAPAGRFSLGLSALYGRDGGEGSGTEQILSIRWDRPLGRDLGLFATLGTEHDDREGLDLRTSLAAGVTRPLWSGARGEILGEVGLGVSRRDLEDASVDGDVEAVAGLSADLDLPGGFRGSAGAQLATAIDEGLASRLTARLEASRPVTTRIRAAAGIVLRTDAQAPAGTDTVDLQLRAGLALAF